jgi:hypothetical protein
VVAIIDEYGGIIHEFLSLRIHKMSNQCKGKQKVFELYHNAIWVYDYYGFFAMKFLWIQNSGIHTNMINEGIGTQILPKLHRFEKFSKSLCCYLRMFTEEDLLFSAKIWVFALNNICFVLNKCLVAKNNYLFTRCIVMK